MRNDSMAEHDAGKNISRMGNPLQKRQQEVDAEFKKSKKNRSDLQRTTATKGRCLQVWSNPPACGQDFGNHARLVIFSMGSLVKLVGPNWSCCIESSE